MSYTIPRKFEELEERIKILEDSGIIESSVVHEYKNLYEFPTVGIKNNLYIDSENNKSYRWDENSLKYICIGSNYEDIKIINGGNSDG